jgi:hypothetical protein
MNLFSLERYLFRFWSSQDSVQSTKCFREPRRIPAPLLPISTGTHGAHFGQAGVFNFLLSTEAAGSRFEACFSTTKVHLFVAVFLPERSINFGVCYGCVETSLSSQPWDRHVWPTVLPDLWGLYGWGNHEVARHGGDSLGAAWLSHHFRSPADDASITSCLEYHSVSHG